MGFDYDIFKHVFDHIHLHYLLMTASYFCWCSLCPQIVPLLLLCIFSYKPMIFIRVTHRSMSSLPVATSLKERKKLNFKHLYKLILFLNIEPKIKFRNRKFQHLEREGFGSYPEDLFAVRNQLNTGQRSIDLLSQTQALLGYIVRSCFNKQIETKIKTECQSDTAFTLHPNLRSRSNQQMVYKCQVKALHSHPSPLPTHFQALCEWRVNGWCFVGLLLLPW